MEIKVVLTASPELLSVLTAIASNGGSKPVTHAKPAKVEPAKEVVTAPVESIAEPAKEDVSTEEITLESLRALTQKKNTSEANKKAIKGFLKELDSDSVSNLAKENFKAFYDKLNSL